MVDLEHRGVLQQGLKSRHFNGGPLATADHEGPILDFYRYMARQLEPDGRVQ